MDTVGDLQVDAEGQQEASRRHHVEFLRTGEMW